MSDFQTAIDDLESAEIAVGSAACLLVDELYRWGETPIVTQQAMRLRRIYESRVARVERLRMEVERGELVNAD